MMNQGSQHNNIEPSCMNKPLQTISLGMGCFWGPDALFGHLPGVVRTRVGYAGGTTPHPTYRQMGDHTEIVEIDFDPNRISLVDILNVFWNHHNPENINDYKGRQYMSLLLYHDELQRTTMHRMIKEGKGETLTSIAPYSRLYLAEDKHQKYYLKRYPNALEKLGEIYSSHDDLVNSTVVARLNGLAKGYTSLERIISEIVQCSTNSNHKQKIMDVIQKIRW